MITKLGRRGLSQRMKEPGITVLSWVDSDQRGSRSFARAFQRAASANPDMEFATIDLGRYPDLAHDWAVEDAPSLMVFRDGTLLYRGTGAASEQELTAVLRGAAAVDMTEMRKRVNGYHGGLALQARSGRPNIQLVGDKAAHQGGKVPRSSGH